MSENTNERPRDELDDLIDECDMINQTGKDREELHRLTQKAVTNLNIANCLADVCETLVMDAEWILKPLGATFQREDKMRFKRMTKAIEDARKRAAESCCGLYMKPCADDFAEDCDFWYNIIRLIADRVGDDKLKSKQLVNWIVTMPSTLHMFDVKKRDFKRIII